MKLLSVLLSLSIVVTAVVGDYIVSNSKYSHSFIFRAIVDNFVHASIGTLSASLFLLKVDLTRQAWLYNVLLCTIVSSVIDLDHFVVAKSIYLKDLINLKQRGFLHCTSLWILITIMLFSYSYMYRKMNVYVLAYMLMLAFTSHHIRDGNRRGIWLYPFGHTLPLNKYVYIFSLSVLPLFLGYIFRLMKPIGNNTEVQYSMLV